MFLVKEEAFKEMVTLLEHLARGRVTCKNVQRESFRVLLELRKAHPEFVKDESITASLAAGLKAESKDANKSCISKGQP